MDGTKKFGTKPDQIELAGSRSERIPGTLEHSLNRLNNDARENNLNPAVHICQLLVLSCSHAFVYIVFSACAFFGSVLLFIGAHGFTYEEVAYSPEGSLQRAGALILTGSFTGLVWRIMIYFVSPEHAIVGKGQARHGGSETPGSTKNESQRDRRMIDYFAASGFIAVWLAAYLAVTVSFSIN